MRLDLSDKEADALANELDTIVRNDRYPLSPRIQTLAAILAKLRPEPAREPLPPPKHYEPPRVGRKATAIARRHAAAPPQISFGPSELLPIFASELGKAQKAGKSLVRLNFGNFRGRAMRRVIAPKGKQPSCASERLSNRRPSLS